MKQCEVRAVKRRLAMYQSFIDLAKEKDKEALLLQESYEAIAGAKAIRYDRESGDGPKREKTSIYHEIFSDQIAAERKAEQYRFEAGKIRSFIDLINADDRNIFVLAYVMGERYWKIGEKLGYSKEGIKTKIDRCLAKIPAATAEACGLL